MNNRKPDAFDRLHAGGKPSKKKKKRGKKKKRKNKSMALESNRIKSGMSHVCSDCGAKEQVELNRVYRAARLRCCSCGGPLQRVWLKGSEGKTRVDQ